MTFLNPPTEVLKQDAHGRVRVTRERREALLDEFERSGASAAQFARLAGIKYPTFANWAQARRKARAMRCTAPDLPGHGKPGAGDGAVRLFEAVVEGAGRSGCAAAGMQGLRIELPGGSRLMIESPLQLPMAAELVALVAQTARARC